MVTIMIVPSFIGLQSPNISVARTLPICELIINVNWLLYYNILENPKGNCQYDPLYEEELIMKVTIRFFALFGELFGKNLSVEREPGTSLTSLIKDIAKTNEKGHEVIFDETGAFREFVILMRNGKRLKAADAETTILENGDEIAVFPPVAGG